MQSWEESLSLATSKSWLRRDAIIFITGDVSETCFAGYCDLLPDHIVHPFTNTDHQLMMSGQLSSTLREVTNARICIETVLHIAPLAVKGALLIYKGNNQAAIYCFVSYERQWQDFGGSQNCVQAGCFV